MSATSTRARTASTATSVRTTSRCLLVIVGVTEDGRRQLVAVEDGYRESEASWTGLLTDLKQRGLEVPPKLATGDGALGFWKALHKVYPTVRHQRCWAHKTANVLNKLPKSVQPTVKAALQEIWMAPAREVAHQAFDQTVTRFQAKYEKAMECLAKDRDELLAAGVSLPKAGISSWTATACSIGLSLAPGAWRGQAGQTVVKVPS